MENTTTWKLPRTYAKPEAALEEAGYSSLLSAILRARGIHSASDAEKYLGRGEDMLCGAMLLNDMEKAVARIEKAIAAGDRTAVYGDYDVDGITASCLVADYLRRRGLDCEIYIPDRIDEGYGLNPEAVAALHEKGVKLLITVDCGITAVAEARRAADLGMDVIITDHHECPSVLPEAAAVINPKRPDSTYPNDILAGVGVAFKLVCALEGSVSAMLSRYCDLVAVGTVADVMPLVGENRVLVFKGLEKLKTAPRPGFAALLEESGISGRPMSSTTVGFSLAPRINAAGRLCQTKTSVSLLLTENAEEAKSCASELCALNRRRQELEVTVWNEAVEILGTNPPDAPIVLAGENWHPGVVGIAASRLSEEYRLPAIIIHLDGDLGKGSCRSYGSFNLFEALGACSEYLEGYGGHAFAAGLTVRCDRIDSFRQALAEYYRAHRPDSQPELEPELLLSDLSLLSMEDVKSLDALEPCGGGNPKPLICVCGAVLDSIAPIGGGRHLRLHITKNGLKFDCVFFSCCADNLSVREGQAVDLCFVPQINEFRGAKGVQLLVSGIRCSEMPRLCREALAGLVSDCGDIGLDRETLANAWRRLTQCPDNRTLTYTDIFASAELGADPVRLCLCLKVFEELGLLDIRATDTSISISKKPGSVKTELDKSPLFRRMAIK
jgi:single-stranded-DNA-specific exonuclease